MGDKCEIMRPEHLEHPLLEDKWETSLKSRGQSTESIESLLGDKWETSLKSRGQSTESMGDKWETNGRQV